MPTVIVPTVLRPHVGDQTVVHGAGATLAEVLADLGTRHPGLVEVLVERGELKRFVNVFVDDEDVRYLDGLQTALVESSEIVILPAVAGG